MSSTYDATRAMTSLTSHHGVTRTSPRIVAAPGIWLIEPGGTESCVGLSVDAVAKP